MPTFDFFCIDLLLIASKNEGAEALNSALEKPFSPTGEYGQILSVGEKLLPRPFGSGISRHHHYDYCLFFEQFCENDVGQLPHFFGI